jgi:hypothetical protein
MACVGQDVVVRSKFLAPTPMRLRCEDLRAQIESSGLRLTSYSKVPEQLLRLWSKMIFTTNRASYFSNSSMFSVAANVWHPLAVREGRASRLLRPYGSRVELGHL